LDGEEGVREEGGGERGEGRNISLDFHLSLFTSIFSPFTFDLSPKKFPRWTGGE
jgi:hypothetical protein